MTRAEYRLLADWGREGTFSHSQSDLSDDWLSVETTRGREYGYPARGLSIAGQMSAQLNLDFPDRPKW